MLSKVRHSFVLVLIVLLPFHALFVTVGTRFIEGQGHAPLTILSLWKEILIIVIFFIAILELVSSDRKKILEVIKGRQWIFHIDATVWCILGLLFFAFAIQFVNVQSSMFNPQFLYGFKYDFVPLIFFLLLAQLEWDGDFLEKRLLLILLIVGGIVAAYGLITFFLPQNFFTFLGYSDAHSIYAPGSPLSAFQQISGTGIRRIQSTFSGPNQLGLWLLVPWSVGLCVMLSEGALFRPSSSPSLRSGSAQDDTARRRRSIPILLLIAFALFLTFSRSAWIAAFVIAIVAMWKMLKNRRRVFALGYLVLGTFIGIAVVWFTSPSLIDRAISNRHHLERLQGGIQTMIHYPLGLGLGAAGPASNRVSDACLYFDEGADISWAKDRSDLCLFVNDMQVQPSLNEKSCHCPLLPENWYIQIGIELGVIGFALFLALCFFIINRLSFINTSPIFLAFIGVSVAALFLHAWEDSAVAYTVWGVVGVALSMCHAEERGRRLSVSKHTAP